MREFKRPNFNNLEKLDALLIEYTNIKNEILYYSKRVIGKYKFLKKNKELKNCHLNKRVFIIGNAPSINDVDLTLLKDEITFMVNRSVSHKDYEKIQPNYHVFIDPKITTGQWSTTYLDEIYEKNPNCTLLLHADWYDLDIFDNFKKKMPIYWLKTKFISPLFPKRFKIDLTTISTSCYVVEQAITSAIYMGASEIYLLGVEGDGIAYQLLNQGSHFSGKDPDYEGASPFELARTMYFVSQYIRMWYSLAEYCFRNDVQLTNLTPRGVIRMINTDNYENVIATKIK